MWMVRKGPATKDPFNDGELVGGRLTLAEARTLREATLREVSNGIKVWIAIDRSLSAD